MKTQTVLLAIIIIPALFSCKKNSQDSLATGSKFTYNGKEYSLTKGYLHDDLDKRFDVSFFSSGVNVTTQGGALYVDGKGAGFILALDSAIPTSLSSATYKWPDQTTPGSEMIADAQMGISNDVTNTITGTFRDATYGTGSVTVSLSGQQYTIEFSLLIDGKTASGKYTGTLQNY